MNNCTKYGFNNLIISGSYGGHRRHTTDDGHRTTPWVWHKLPTGELKILQHSFKSCKISTFNFCFLGSVILQKLSTASTTAFLDQHNFGLIRRRNINNRSYES